METVKTVFSKKGTTAELFKAYLDDKELIFKNDEATLYLPKNTEQVLKWFARGKPGSKYVIAITEPEWARFSHSATLDDSQKDAGIYWFKV